MEMLRSKSIIALTIMILGVSYLSAVNNVNVSHSVSKTHEIISERA